MANLLRLSACLFLLLSFNVFAVDTDGDGFSDADEATLGTDPNDPTSPLENKLTPVTGSAYDEFGRSVSIDGDTLAIGVPFSRRADIGSRAGLVYIYERNNGVWTQQSTLQPYDEGIPGYTNANSINAQFGYSVSLDGNTLLVGAFGYNIDGVTTCAAYVYERVDGVWNEQQMLTPSDTSNYNSFGYSVSIDDDTMVIAGFKNAYVYVRNNSIWSEQGILSSDYYDYRGNSFGISVSIDGDFILVGAMTEGDDNRGAVYVFERSNDIWSKQAKLTPSDSNIDDEFGWSVSILGNRAVIGALQQTDEDFYVPNSSFGAVYVYEYSNGIWNEQAKLTPSDGEWHDRFGISVSISENTILVGSFDDDDYGISSGSAYVYVYRDGLWSEHVKLTPIDGSEYDEFGLSVSLDGETAVVSAPKGDGSEDNTGFVYTFPLTLPLEDTLATITGATFVNVNIGGFGFGTLIATDIDGLTDGTYFSISSPPANGQALINATTGNWIYTANNSYVGSDPFTVTVTDDLGGTTEQVVSITITAPDSDGDGAYDHQDNCPSVSNADQANLDGDVFGDVCDDDKDGDGFTSDFDLNDLNAFYSTDPDGDGVDSSGESHYTNNVCLRAPNCNENDPCITVCYVPPQDNCPAVSNSEQNDLDNDNLGNVCDSDADGDGLLFAFEDRLGGSDMDANDVSFVLSNANTYFENAPADSDLDGIIDSIETAAGTNPNDSSDGEQAELSILELLGINKQVPAMGGFGLLTLGISILALGLLRGRNA